MKKMLAALTASIMLCLSAPAPLQTVCAEEPRSNICCFTDEGSNLNHHNYYGVYHNWAEPIYSYLHPLPDGRWMRVQTDDSRVMDIMVEYYDPDFQLTERFGIPRLLEDFGTFHIGSDGNYYVITCTQIGDLTSMDEPKFDIAKYSTDWELLDHVQTLGKNVVKAAYDSVLRCADDGKHLVIRTSHLRKDGHQSNYTLDVDMQDMKINFEGDDRGYVSHSFNQFVMFDGDNILMLDHGDGYPRAVQLFRNYASMAKMVEYAPLGDVDQSDMHIINYTGVSVGGFEKSSTHYLVAYNSINQDNWHDLAVSRNYEFSETVRNVYVAAVPKDQLSTANVKTIPITAYAEGESSGGNPYLIPAGDDRFLLMWAHGRQVCWQFLDGAGNVTGRQYTMDGALSDCEPVVSGNKVYWYTWDYSDIRFYSIDLTNPEQTETFTRVAGHETEPVGEPDAEGRTEQVCSKCGLRIAADAPKYMIGLQKLQPERGRIYKTEFYPEREYLDTGDKFEYYLNKNGVQDLWLFDEITEGEDYVSYGGETGRYVVNGFDEPSVRFVLFLGRFSNHPKSFRITAKHNYELQSYTAPSGGQDGSITLKCSGCGHVSTFAADSLAAKNGESVSAAVSANGEVTLTLTDPAAGEVTVAEPDTDYTVAYVRGTEEGSGFTVIVAAKDSTKITGSRVLQTAAQPVQTTLPVLTTQPVQTTLPVQTALTTQTEPVPGTTVPENPQTLQDAELLRKWLCCMPDTELTGWQAMDLNYDQKLDAADLTRIKQQILAQKAAGKTTAA